MGRLVDVAFDLDMLSAEIEVYKLAEDAKKQAIAASFSRPVSGTTFAIASGFKQKVRRRRPVAGAKETRMSTVLAAPPAVKPPASLYAATQAPPSKPEKPKRQPPKILPKDEVAPKAGPAVATTTSLGIKDDDDKDEGVKWWVWALVGVAGAAAVAGGSYGVYRGVSGSGDEGALTVRW